MAHFLPIQTDEILNGPVDYSTPVGSVTIFRCSATVRDHIERRKPVAKKFTSDASHDSFWLRKFEHHAGINPDFVVFAKAKTGVWYVQAVCL